MAKALTEYDVIIRPVITEKSNLVSADLNQYTFEVAMSANKIQVKDAIELVFEVPVVNVNTMVMPKKRARRGRKFYVRKAAWKKAVVTVASGHTIDLFSN
ncbi:MAG: 50S ribosomal protein L23 [Anaerolineales bacterium]|nr:50S ribosomal protein L23 [Anaerolineales bacterium]